ncbi:hypothetical protein PMI32_00314 [Pseudomonas sp. GM60]|nr:hypothetical protein PMI32_00314 [Pseudomonas sp. GM60]
MVVFVADFQLKALIIKALFNSYSASQALMPKRCNVLLESVKELPPLQVLEKKGDGLCHDRPLKTQNPVGAELARESGLTFNIDSG